MNDIEKLKKYDLHDSLLESITYDKKYNKVNLEIDFCNWKQEWYDESTEETSMISLVFENTSDVIIPEFKPNSDEIIQFELLTCGGVRFVVFNDIDNNYYEIVINAKNIKIINNPFKTK